MGKIERLWEEHTRLLMATKDAAHALRTLTNAARAHRNAMSITSSTVANRRKQARASVAVESACMDADRMATALEKPASDSIASHLTAAIPQPAPDVQAALVTALEQVKAALGDRLLGNGPLSKEYAHGVMRQINAALTLAGRKP